MQVIERALQKCKQILDDVSLCLSLHIGMNDAGIGEEQRNSPSWHLNGQRLSTGTGNV